MPEQYSLWLVPPPALYEQLQRVITTLSEKHSTPLLEPHVTLYGRIVGKEAEVRPKIEQLAKSVPPLHIALTDFGQRDEFYRSIFIHAEKSKGLQQAYDTAHHLFNHLLHSKYAGREFIPHLSIMYGNVPQEEKEKIIASLDRSLLTPFTADIVSLYRLVQEPAQWVKVNDFSFNNTPSF